MPELPEVQVVINYLNKSILNKTIKNVDVKMSKFLKNSDVKEFKKFFKNHYFKNIIRRAKYLIFILDNDSVMVSHLRMEGKYNCDNEITKHDYIIFYFDDGSMLKYNDTRQFGTFNLYKNLDLAYKSKELNKLGYEPFDKNFNDKMLYEMLKKSNKKIKTFLLDQTKLVGLGNIYVNEVCFKTKIDPSTIANKITKQQAKDILEATREILADSIKHNGTTIHSFTFNKWSTGNYQDKLMIHQKKECPICHSKITPYKINGRGTYACHKCQKGNK